MLTLTKRAEYALVAISHLANCRGQICSARDIAEEHRVPLPLLMNVLKRMTQANLVSSTRGSRGGYQLAQDPSAISLHELILAVDAPIALVPCAHSDSEASRCEREDVCAIRGPLNRVHAAFETFLESVSIADLAFDQWPVELKLSDESGRENGKARTKVSA